MTDTLPAPPVPADADLRGLEWMPIYGHRLFGSNFDAHANDTEFRAGLALWWAAWNQVPAASLPDDDVALCRLAGLGRDAKLWKKIKARAMHGFDVCADGRLYHRALAPMACEAWERRLRDRARKAKWRERGASQEQPSDTPEDVPETGTRRGHDADGTVPETSARPSRERLTGEERTGQEVKKEETPDGVSPRTRTRAPPQPCKIPIPSDWQPTPETRQTLAAQGYSDHEIDWQRPRFVGYWLEKREKRPGWERSFVTWVTNDPPGKHLPAGNRGGHGGGRTSLVAAVGSLLASLPDSESDRH